MSCRTAVKNLRVHVPCRFPSIVHPRCTVNMLVNIATAAILMPVYALFETRMLDPRTTVQDINLGNSPGLWKQALAGYTALK